MHQIFDFAYLDSARLHILISQIQGGRVDEITETLRQKGGLGAGLKIGVPPFVGNIDSSRNNESERQQTLKLTDPAYFKALYQHLIDNNFLLDITAASLQIRSDLQPGQFVELNCNIEPPFVETWISNVNSLLEFIQRNIKLFSVMPQTKGQQKGKAVPPLSNQQLSQFRSLLDFMTDYINLAKKDPSKIFLRGTDSKLAFAVWSGLSPDYVTTPLQTALPGEYRIFGRIERIFLESEVWKIVDFSHFAQAQQAEQLINALNGFSALTGQKPISINDFQAQYPDILITPIAVFR